MLKFFINNSHLWSQNCIKWFILSFDYRKWKIL